MKKRILSVLITLVMLIGMLPVTAFAAGEHTHCICGETHASVGDHTTEQSVEWTAWNGTDAISYDSTTKTAYVYLSDNAERSSTLTVESGNTLYLCLNGKKLSYAGSGKVSIFTVANGATLNITDCGSTGTITGSTGDYGAVQNGTGTFNLYAGTITANKRGVYNGGTFSMYGGNIAGNSDDGVWNTSSFNLYGSKITYNTGWGVNNDGGTFTMYNGEISHNSHNAAEVAVKCGVMNSNGGTFTMNGGKIAGNNGNGVQINGNQNAFTMNGGKITENVDGIHSSGVVTINGGEISSNTGDGVYTTHVFTMNGGKISGNDRGVMYDNGTASVSGAPVIKDNANGNFCDYQGGYYLTVSGALTDGAYIGVTLEEKFGEAAGPSMYDDTLPAAPDYIEYFYSDEGYGIYAEGDSIFVGNYITEQPNAENNYKVKTNDDANAIYQWYSVETDEVTVTYDFLVEQDTGFDWMYNGNFDSQTNKWEPVGFSGGFGYLSVALNAGETFIAEFDSALPAGYVALLGGWDNDNVIQATQQNGNIYTFKATEAGIYVLMVAEEDEEPVALSEVVIPNVVCKMNALIYTPLDGQNEATLDITGLESGAYICKTAWDIYDTPEYPEDDYYCISAPVTLQYYDVTFDYDTLGSETKTVLNGETVTPPAPVFAGKVLVGWYTDSSFATEFNFSDAITANKTIYAKFADYEDDKEALNNKIDAAKTDLQSKIDAVESALAGKADAATLAQAITDLNTAKTNIQTLLEQIDDYADADTALKAELITKIETADNLINTAISDLTSRVETLESELAAAKSDISTNASKVAQLTADLATINASLTDLSNKLTNDYATKAELTNAINSAKDTINSTIDALTIRVQNLEAGLAEANGKININTTNVGTLKTDVSTLKTWQTEAQNAIEALETLTGTQGTNIFALQAAVAELQATMNTASGKIAAAENRIAALEDKVSALETAKTNLENAVSALQTAVADKADTATVNAAIAELKTAIEALEAVKNNYIGADDDLRTELEGKIANAQTAAISAAETLVNNAKAELQSKIDAKADAATTTVAIQNLQAAVAALEAVKDDYATADATLKTELEGKIETAKSEAITAANTALTTAKNELSQAIALKADTATLNAKVDALNTAIANAESVAKAYADTQDAALKAELQTAIANAKSEAIGAAQLLVDNAKAELQTAIDTKADTATVNAAIANLQNAIAALEAAKDNYASADAALKLELEAAIERAKQEAIEASKGYIPYIGTNGNWWIGNTDTGVDANGIKGDTGATGNGIASITTSKANGITTVTIKFTDPNMADVVFTIEDGADGADGAKGDTGAQGEKGDKGNTGAAGADGVGIAKIEKTSSDGNVDTYTITLTNGTTYTFTVTNGTNGTDGKDGKDGVDGKDGTNGTNGVDGKDGTDGEDGQTPYIGENGNWWIGDTDTGVKAAGDDGKDGAIIVATAVGGTALISNIALIAWALIKKKRLF